MRPMLALVVGLLIWLFWSRANRALFDDALSPFNLLLYFWVLPFVASLAELSGLQTGVGPEAIVVVLASTTILLATCLLPALLMPAWPKPPFRWPSNSFTEYRSGAVLTVLAAALVALYFAEFYGRNIPLLAYVLDLPITSNMHTAGKDSKLQIVAFVQYAAALFIGHSWLTERRPGRRRLWKALAASIVLIGLVKTSKSDIYIPILGYAALIYYHNRAHGTRVPRSYKIAAMLLGVLLVSVTAFRLIGIGIVGGYANIIAFKYTQQLGALPSEFISIVYGYMSLGFQNLSNYIESTAVTFRIGTSMFRPLLSMFMMGSIADEMGVPVGKWHVVTSAANTGTYLTPLYIEGGLLFCCLGSLAYGLLVNTVYLQFRSQRTTRGMLMYVSLLFPWTWMFFTNAFSVLSIYANLFVVLLLADPRRLSERVAFQLQRASALLRRVRHCARESRL